MSRKYHRRPSRALERKLLLVLTIAGGILQAGDPFSLRLSGVTEAWFPNSTVVRMPASKCSKLEVRFTDPSLYEVTIDQLVLEFDGVYPKPNRSTTVGSFILTVQTREPKGLLTKEEHHVKASAAGKHPRQAEWTITQWEKSYIEAITVGPKSAPISVRIDQPAGGVVLADTNSGRVRFVGELSGSIDTRLTIAGEEVKRLAKMPGFHFDQQINIPHDSPEVIVVASDEAAGDSTILALKTLTREGR